MSETGVSVRLERSAEDTRKFVVRVRVLSKRKPGLMASSDLDPGKYTVPRQLLRAVGYAGAAGAEYLAERYGDNLDPGHVSVVAQRVFAAELRLVAELHKAVPEKLRRLEGLKYGLSNGELELLSLWTHRERKGERATVGDVAAMDKIIRRFRDAG